MQRTWDFVKGLPSKKHTRNGYRVLTAPAVDSEGRRHPTGTIFIPRNESFDGNSPYQEVVINGEIVRFYRPNANSRCIGYE